MSVVVVGDGPAAVRAALTLADAGVPVHHLVGGPTLPANGWKGRPDRIRATQHPQITTYLETTLREAEPNGGGWRIAADQRPQYVDPARCTACGKCAEVCPVTVVGPDGIPTRAIVRGHAPTTFHIQKSGASPCREACPVGQHAQGYVALIRERRYLEAYHLIRADNPFPSLCGRICHHYCEQACTRNRVDEPVAVMALKRFVTDWAYDHRGELPDLEPSKAPPSGKRVAIVGAGPAGLTAAQQLVRMGHEATVYEKLPVAGGMLRVGIPPFRLPDTLIDWEVQQILDEGVALRLNTPVESVDALLNEGYDAVFLAIGAHEARKLPIPGHDLPEVGTSLELLRTVNLGERVDLTGKRVLVLGGGNVAIDVARTAARLGAAAVSMTCLESREQMPASPWELEAAEEEGIQVVPGRTFKEIVAEEGRVTGVRCVEVIFRGFIEGRPDFDEIPGTEHVLPADGVYFAIGQRADLSLLPEDGGVAQTPWGTIVADAHTFATNQPGVFAAADCVTGPVLFAIDAIAAGQRAARSMDAYLRGETVYPPSRRPERSLSLPPQGGKGDSPSLPAAQPPSGGGVARSAGVGGTAPAVELTDVDIRARIDVWGAADRPREPMPELSLDERLGSMAEVDLGYDEETALREAARCLSCGVCSECLQCEIVCPAHAIHHDAPANSLVFDAHAVVCADGQTELPNTLTLDSNDETRAYTLALQLISALKPTPSQLQPYATSTPADRVGVFLCRCGGVISDAIDQEAIAAALYEPFGAAHVQTVDFACHPEGGEAIRAAMEAHALDRAVLAACTCCAVDQVCESCSNQRIRCKTQLLREARLPVDFVNVREHAAFIHPPETATVVALDLIAGALARVRALGADWPGGPIAHIDQERCRDCSDCVSACGLEALRINQNGQTSIVVDAARCLGCGSCMAACPTGAMRSGDASDAAIEAMLGAMDLTGKVVVFTCNWDAYTGFEMAGMHRMTYPDNVRFVRLMCAGRLHAGLVLKTFAMGAAGVLVLRCHTEDCHYHSDASQRLAQAQELAALMGIGPERFHVAQIAAGDGEGFLATVNAFAGALASQEV
jgi:NADPH-dependent glutamate synthase beta subunit-like oxidoreductase/coenzyme F420-reducing hydrogenase delta subunit/NAD-dependent dihydropyrimidine dehydrogenase PreA subunit